MICPRCGSECERDEGDFGSHGPWGCPICHWVEGDYPIPFEDQWPVHKQNDPANL